VAALRRSVQSSPTAVRRRRVLGANPARIFCQERAQPVGVTVFGDAEEPGDIFRLPLVNFRFYGPPTRETEIPRKGEQKRGELGLRIGAPQLLQSILRQPFQIFERRHMLEVLIVT